MAKITLMPETTRSQTKRPATTRNSNARVAILVFPFEPPATFVFPKKLAAALACVAASTTLISGGIPGDLPWPEGVQVCDIDVKLHPLNKKRPLWLAVLRWIGEFVRSQVGLARQVIKLRHDIDIVVCVLGAYYQLPILAARILGKKVVCASLGLDSLSAKVSYGSAVATLIGFMARFNYGMSHAVLVESMRLRTYKDLRRLGPKLHNGALFLGDRDRFSTQVPLEERENLVGYIGRLVPVKGVMEFVNAIPLALELRPDLRFLIIGSGMLEEALEEAMRGQTWATKVTWIRWTAHERVPVYLNQLKLTVIPSYSEGLPNLALEAMGCGTPVLATQVGGIPDLVVDGETGFLLDDNSPAAIAQAIVRCVDDPKLQAIACQAQDLVDRSYSLDAASRRYAVVMEELGKAR